MVAVVLVLILMRTYAPSTYSVASVACIVFLEFDELWGGGHHGCINLPEGLAGSAAGGPRAIAN